MKKNSVAAIFFVISAAIIAIPLQKFPDLDIAVLGIGLHRNFLFHSTLISFLAYKIFLSKRETILSFIKNGIIFGLSITIGLHLLFDVFQNKSVHFIIVSTLIKGTSIDDRLWLLINSILSFYISIKTYRAKNENIFDIRRKSKIE